MAEQLNVLVLGGTKFLGRHMVDDALARGHRVTLFNRGQTNPELYPEVERLHGDRDGGLDALRGRSFDAVLDTSGFVPRIVDATADVLAPNVGHYVFVSSCSAYADQSRPGDDESAATAVLADPASEDVTADYGPLKAACEAVVGERFRGRSAILRAGLIVGPHDPTNRFTYWVTRIARGGRVLVPAPPEARVQLIDARDVAAFALDLAERLVDGTFNVKGPAQSLTFGEMVATIRDALASDAELVWADERVLLDAGVEPWMGLPLWLAVGANPDHAGFMSRDVSRGLAAGLQPRPLAETARDTLAWASAVEPARGERGFPAAGLDPGKEQEILARVG